MQLYTIVSGYITIVFFGYSPPKMGLRYHG